MKNTYFKLKSSVTDSQLAEFGLSFEALKRVKAIDKRGRLHGHVEHDRSFVNGFEGYCLIDSRYGMIIPCLFIEGFAEEYKEPEYSFTFIGSIGQVAETKAYTLKAALNILSSFLNAGNSIEGVKFKSPTYICKSELVRFTDEQVSAIFDDELLKEPELNKRGNIIEKRSFVGSHGFFFDEVDTQGVTPRRIHEDSYTACYACAITLKVWSYAEGDMVTVKCKDMEAFNLEVDACTEFYKEG